MAEVVKLSEEELNSLKNLQAKWNILTRQFGELHYQKKCVDNELVLVDQELDALEQSRIDIIQKLQNQYGQGSVDLDTGEFIPDLTKN